MGAQVELVLRGKSDQDLISIYLEPTNIPLAGRWLDELERTLSGLHFLEKDQNFAGFLDSRRDQRFLCSELNGIVNFFRDYRGPGAWENGYDIGTHFDPDSLGHAKLNLAHHHFEILRGQAWSQSRFVDHLRPEGAEAVRRLNVIIHQLEALEHSKNRLRAEGKICPYSSIHFLTPDMNKGLPLHDEDYDHFSFEENFGVVQMHYCQIGKTHIHAWSDGDTDIFDENINNLRYYSAGFAIGWTEHAPSDIRYAPFLDWLRGRGVELSGKNYFVDQRGVKQGLGFLNIARIPLIQFGGRSISEIQSLIGQHDDIFKIRVHRDGRTVESKFNYRVDDRDYTAQLIRAIPAN